MMRAILTARQLSSGYWYIRGCGPCEWAQQPTWPGPIQPFTEASEAFCRRVERWARHIAERRARLDAGKEG